MYFCDTTCTCTFFSVRHDKKTICEGREWTFANVCLFSQPCDRSASRRVTLESFKKSVRQLLFLSVVDNYMILMSLLTRFCLFRAPDCFFLKKMSRNPTNSFLSVVCRLRQLLFTDFNHVYLFVSKTGCKITKISSESCSFMQLSFTSYWYFVVFTSKIYYLCH